MAMDPSEVETSWGSVWMTLAKCADGHTLADFRCTKFRRAKPKRSRVQEMAEETEAVISDPRWTPKQAWMTHAISAVCKFVRETWTVHGVIAPDIEREFLVPR
jgi:hypothetical protein